MAIFRTRPAGIEGEQIKAVQRQSKHWVSNRRHSASSRNQWADRCSRSNDRKYLIRILLVELGGLDAKLTAAAVVNENEISHLKRASSISYNWVLTVEYVPRIIVNERFYSPFGCSLQPKALPHFHRPTPRWWMSFPFLRQHRKLALFHLVPIIICLYYFTGFPSSSSSNIVSTHLVVRTNTTTPIVQSWRCNARAHSAVSRHKGY